ncbi:hypothetical protein B0H63DRAFT_472483 [Podospora didyma]|uniref:Aflatoxin regulatory protein domain-containing protein n=1 Tax=Podospora didyma TaxID=330526 RepID=A0AAE0TZA9_9PEZI|nr:hypothetical protein B0H63DRAFT_472483 [Podospora didyma]
MDACLAELTLQSLQSLDMDFAMSDIAFDPTDYDLALLIGGHHPSPRNETGVDSRHRRGGSDRVSNIFGHRDDFNGTNGDMLGWPSHNGGGLSDAPQTSTVEPARKHDPAPHIPNTNGESRQHVLQAPGCYIDLLKLSLELVEDQYIIETQAPLDGTPTPPPHECPPAEQSRFINRVLNQSSRFWDILKTMSLEAESQRQRTTSAAKSNGESNGFHNGNGHTNGGSNGGSLDSGAWRGWTRPRTGDTNNSNGNRVDMDLYGTSSSSSSSSSPPVASHRVDPVLVVNLVMTYVYLLRSCRAVFVRLYQALEMTPTAESRSPLRLPSLQFGDFQLENNLAIQVKVLVEMMSGMLLRIGNTLGISPSGVIVPADGNASPPAEDRDCRLPFMSDPVAVSVREIILSQERAQGGGITRPGEAPPLPEIMANLRRLLGRRYSVV